MNIQTDVGWMFQVGDPTFGAWLVTIGYIVSSAMCTRIFFCEKEIEIVIGNSYLSIQLDSRLFWLACGIFTLAMGLNKQLDFQTLLIELLQEKSGNSLVENASRTGAISFFLLVTASAGYTYLVFSSLANKCGSTIRLGLLGLTLILIYIAYRASAIHHFQGAVQSGSNFDKLILFSEPAGVLFLIFAASNPLRQAMGSYRLTYTGVTKPNSED